VIRPNRLDDMERELRLTLRNDLAEIAGLGQTVRQFLAENGVGPRPVYVVDLALEELLSNIVKYAHPQGGDHPIEVGVRLAAGRVVVTIEDDGVPFDPLEFPPLAPGRLVDQPRGQLGIHLVRRLVDDVSYTRRDGGNRIQLAVQL
jgi:serine/threonine-protein kinase RsbW